VPLVSIGLPAHNGARYITQTLNSLISQTFTDFELIISDDASTDRTLAICKEFADKDKRLRLYRNERNIGMLQNFRLVFERSQAQYFMWASDHDVWLPEFIEEHVAVLDQFPEVVLAYPLSKDIDANDTFLPIEHKRFENDRRRLYDLWPIQVRCTGKNHCAS
jgi:glycosyltransferase involved in cell wall biosynthesis